MTFSIAARSADGSLHGVAVASKFLAVGALAPAAEPAVGAVATQAFANPAYKYQGLAMLRTGVAAPEAVAALTAADLNRSRRQLGIVDAVGGAATYTGEECTDWAGGRCGDDFAAQGNILPGPEVVDAMVESWLNSTDMPFFERLLSAVQAGDRAGGDKRGRQSAALFAAGKGEGYGGGDVAVDLRVDDHPAPIVELERLLRMHRMHFTRLDPASMHPLEGALAADVRELLRRLGYADTDLDTALEAWAGAANLEQRIFPGRVDPLVLEHLRAEAAPTAE